jgi:citrate lyase subunit beta/citryl-CoA lyase
MPFPRPTKWRSVLFAPASVPEVAAKLPRSGPDCVVLDLEDAVPAGEKAVAREHAARLAPELRAQHPDLGIFVRVNASATEHFAADLEALTPALSGVMVPMVETAAERDEVLAALRAAGHGDLPLFVGIETARGIIECERILDSPAVAAAYFGAEDYVVDLGGVRTEEGTEVLYARSRLAVAARAMGVAAVDQVVIALRDSERFLADAAAGRALGYRGKLCIHPAQVTLANKAFGPSEAELDRARRMIAAFDAAVREGRGSIDFEGQMVDEPIVRQARAVVALAEPVT